LAAADLLFYRDPTVSSAAEAIPMADIVNLRQARKRKARAEKEAQAQANRVAFGRTKEERRLGEAQTDLETRRLEGHRLDPKEPE
jgi:hypothetical protein